MYELYARRPASFDDCTDITALCPVSATVLGYVPNKGSSIFFTVCFAILFLSSVGLGVWKKTWTYAATLGAGLLLETIGYIGRIQMDPNPWNSSAFQTQICCIIIAPTFICAAIYLTLKHVALALSPDLSRIHPRWYPRIFLPADLSCLIIQAIGGGVAAAAKRNQPELARNGNRTIIAGVVLQVIVLLAFGAMGTDYYLRVKKYLHSSEAAHESLRVWQDKKFRMFGFAVSGAYFAILTRCIYRIAEMAGGWGNHIMQDEPSFLVLDSSLVLVTGFLLTAFHPGIFFPQMAVTMQRTKKTEAETPAESSSEEQKVENSQTA
ncbi:RTA1 like protein-domain-containing protein [Fusarium redolens]|uniref:RTA1 like protein-domain-containing protein n=1 Tax=Fusarium redolens TaxID=48865 RepID=A0A9P9H313_FUSRE|nr:RTA1 like protein-domain-containing protein [Fusarium redolens]KAH7248917.1 RTA1 like protein-domain-containing protein [Fusarium redolens]